MECNVLPKILSDQLLMLTLKCFLFTKKRLSFKIPHILADGVIGYVRNAVFNLNSAAFLIKLNLLNYIFC